MRLVTIGETLGVVATSGPGPVGSGAAARLGMAGSESNVAIGVTRLGADATWIGHVGDDPFGRLILRELRAEGVDVRGNVLAQPTGLLIREQRTLGHADVTYHRTGSAGAQLSPADIPDDVLVGADLVHISGITAALGDGPAAAADRLVTMAKDAGIPVSLDVNYRARLWTQDAATQALRPLLARADIVFAGEHEAALFTSHTETGKIARALSDLGPRTVVVKLGAKGSQAFRDGLDYVQPAIPVAVADTVGAGDAFAAGYLADLMAGLDPAQCLATAAVMGAFAVSTIGDWEGLPRRDELSLFASTEETQR